jgi:predicted MPP superfamily phosphohydrolase
MQLVIRIIVFVFLVSLIEFYFISKIKNSLKFLFPKFVSNKTAKIIKILLVVLNIYPVFLIVDWGFSELTRSQVFIPQSNFFDFLIIYPFWVYLFVAIQSILFFLLLELIKLLLIPVYKKYKPKIKLGESYIVLALTVCFLIYVPARICYDYFSVDVREVSYEKPGLAGELSNFKIVFISDLHADRYTSKKRLENFITKVNEAHPDLVLIGGDFISSYPDYIGFAAMETGKIKSKYGIYSCVGDHDNWAYPDNPEKSLTEIKESLKKNNISMFDNANKKIVINSQPVLLTFTTDTYVRRVSQSTLTDLVSDTGKYALKILLTHQPGDYLMNSASKHNYDLFLAGHTHGGQITFLFPFINLTPTMFETKYIRGNYNMGKMLIIVTRGLGMSLVPMRYNSSPEITIINITR